MGKEEKWELRVLWVVEWEVQRIWNKIKKAIVILKLIFEND
jgi:hypothetical protein